MQNKLNKIGFTGLAFKGVPATSDLRGSAAVNILKSLKLKNKKIYVHDFVCKTDEISNLGEVIKDFDEILSKIELLIILNNHKNYSEYDVNYCSMKMKKPKIILDVWSNLFNDPNPNNKYFTLGNILL